MDEREKSGISRNDLVDTLVNLKNEDMSKDESATDIGIKIFPFSLQ